MSRFALLAVALVFVAAACGVHAQDGSARVRDGVSGSDGDRASELAAALDKTKYKKKEKHGNTYEFYLDIRNKPRLPASGPSEFSGKYVCDSGESKLDLKVSADGTAAGSGWDTDMNDNKTLAFTLRDARVDGSLLRATKVFDDGKTETLEAVFVDRTTSTGKNAQTIEEAKIEFGLGYVMSGKDWTNRVFMHRK